MAQVALIKEETARPGLQYIGDLVVVARDEHIFSDTEYAKFNILRINGSVEDVNTRLSQIKPRIAIAFKWPSDSKYHFAFPGPGIEPLDEIQVFRVYGDTKWYRLDNAFKFPINLDSLTPEEKQLLETVDINHPSVSSFIMKVVKNLAELSGNDVEIKDLRNQEP